MKVFYRRAVRRLSAIFFAVVFFSTAGAHHLSAAILFESGTLGTTGVPWQDVVDQVVLGANLDSNAFNGVRFELTQPVMTTRIGGHFVAPSTGTFFGAIVKLGNETDFPDSGDLLTEDVLGNTLLTFPTPSAEVFGALSLTLDPGWYALVFGSGLFGATGDGAALLNNIDIGTPDYIGFLSGFGWGNRLPGMRFVLEGTIIPEPTAISLIFAASILFVIRLRSHRH